MAIARSRDKENTNRLYWGDSIKKESYLHGLYLFNSNFIQKHDLSDFEKLLPKSKDITIDIGDNEIIIPSELEQISNVINQSRCILELENDWDMDNAKKIDTETWDSAMLTLINYAKFILKTFATVIQPPEINPVPNGSVDLSWRTKKARFLMNFKPNGSEILASYYGDLYNDKDRIKNVLFDKSIIAYLAYWMQNLV